MSILQNFHFILVFVFSFIKITLRFMDVFFRGSKFFIQFTQLPHDIFQIVFRFKQFHLQRLFFSFMRSNITGMVRFHLIHFFFIVIHVLFFCVKCILHIFDYFFLIFNRFVVQIIVFIHKLQFIVVSFNFLLFIG